MVPVSHWCFLDKRQYLRAESVLQQVLLELTRIVWGPEEREWNWTEALASSFHWKVVSWFCGQQFYFCLLTGESGSDALKAFSVLCPGLNLQLGDSNVVVFFRGGELVCDWIWAHRKGNVMFLREECDVCDCPVSSQRSKQTNMEWLLRCDTCMRLLLQQTCALGGKTENPIE